MLKRKFFIANFLGLGMCLSTASIFAGQQNKNADNAKITKLSLFKNGVVSVERKINNNAEKVYLDANFQPIHGTLFFSPIDSLIVKKELCTVQELNQNSTQDFANLYKNKKVYIKVRAGEEFEVVKGVVIDLFNSAKKQQKKSSEPILFSGYHGNRQGGQLFIQDEKDKNVITSIAAKDIISITSYNGINLTKDAMREMIVFTPTKKSAVQSTVNYLTYGMSWAPSYRYILGEDNKLTIINKAVVTNELENINGAEIELISGHPNIKYSKAFNPICLGININSFFNSLDGGSSLAPRVMSQAIFNNAVYQPRNLFRAPTMLKNKKDTINNKDLFYNNIGKLSLKKGESMYVPLGSETTDYKRVIRWEVNRLRNTYGKLRDPSYNQECFDSVIFTNPFKYPLTTGPIEFVEDNKFIGQIEGAFFNPGQFITLDINKALTVGVKFEEKEDAKRRASFKSTEYDPGNYTYYKNARYRKALIHNTAEITNYRTKPIKMLVTMSFTGKLFKSNIKAQLTELKQKVWHINKSNKIVWEIEIGAREKKKITYSYDVWMRD